MNIASRVLVFVGFFGASMVSEAATQLSPAPIIFKSGVTKRFVVDSRGWSTLNNAQTGWTHSSQWGQFKAKAGQRVRITIKPAQNDGRMKSLHPAVTIWYRPSSEPGNKGKGLKYVKDHFYPQAADFDQLGGRIENSSESLGTIRMSYVSNGYDADGNDPNISVSATVGEAVEGISDGVSGQLVKSFIAPQTGVYQFAVGGINPYPESLPSAITPIYPVKVNVAITRSSRH